MLSLLTQVGGLIYLFAYPIFKKVNHKTLSARRKIVYKAGVFLGVYAIFTFTIIPPIAKSFGRVPLPYFHPQLKPLNYLTPLMNRHYVEKDLYDLLIDSSTILNQKYPNSIVAYMDANFPFINNFPLLPHLSHNDGKKVDLTFLYRKINNQQAINRKAKSWIGYGGIEHPFKGEENTTTICEKKGFWQYDLLRKVTPMIFGAKIEIDEKRTKLLIETLANHPQTGKIFIEPFLKSRWE